MLNTKKAVEELRDILKAMNFFTEVGTGKIPDLISDTHFPSVYITMDMDTNINNGQMRKDGGEYDRILVITLQVHLDLTNEDDLYYLDVRDMIEEAILKDTQIWASVIDRDVVGSKWDMGQSLPKKQGEISLTLFTRNCVI